MKLSLTNNEIFNIVYVIRNKFDNTLNYDKRFSYMIDRNLDIMMPIAELLLKKRDEIIPAIREYESKRQTIIDENKDNKDEIVKKVKELDIIYKDILEQKRKDIEAYNEILDDVVELDLVKVSFKAFPDLSIENMRILRKLIKESDEELDKIIND